ncbi:hypothetical protein F5Y04DRAFT_274943 [Hypomontagnella monticulosa]|nr:hypothetical protein F5Y04DRAFT_274943 [Hypomontagnella monticulosa]
MALGMASPLGRQTDEAVFLPTPEPRREPSDYEIYHGDMSNHQNLIFGEFDADEHILVPTLKLIDFGAAIDDISKLATHTNGQNIKANTLSSANIFEIGQVMRQLYGFLNTPYIGIFRPNLDMDFHNLANRCASEELNERPSVTEFFDQVHAAVTTKTGPEHFPGKSEAMNETDEYIKQFVRENILKQGS